MPTLLKMFEMKEKKANVVMISSKMVNVFTKGFLYIKKKFPEALLLS